jgi:hypothetical protein
MKQFIFLLGTLLACLICNSQSVWNPASLKLPPPERHVDLTLTVKLYVNYADKITYKKNQGESYKRPEDIPKEIYQGRIQLSANFLRLFIYRKGSKVPLETITVRSPKFSKDFDRSFDDKAVYVLNSSEKACTGTITLSKSGAWDTPSIQVYYKDSERTYEFGASLGSSWPLKENSAIQ